MITLKLKNASLFEGTILIYTPNYRELTFQGVKVAEGWVLSLNDTYKGTFESVESVFEFLCDSEAGH